MSFKDAVFYTGCAATWLILMPVLIVGGAVVLISYALFAEVGESVLGRGDKSLDDPKAREIAHRLCAGH